MKNYSKSVVKSMIILWFIGAVFGAAVVVVQLVAVLVADSSYTAVAVNLPELLSYIGMPVSGAIVGYLAKSAFENREKIKNNPGYHSSSDPDMHGGNFV